ncbi:tRNA (adenine(22)-N(1))-methyltransferase TrmK [Thalassotalea aquiviva]|uniref:tRNA (adenine(22)-N(1))-methyltransferase TrmK n=1 Tax=Thalassotalea aquiviva TaxID=3242415 RepID=UPI00352A47C6
MSKISHRLLNITEMISKPYQQVWDCCCDHGLLGLHLLEHKIANDVVFIDIVPELMQKLVKKLSSLEQRTHNFPKWQVKCEDVGFITLDKALKQTPLFIIAGVGGDLTLELVRSICQRNDNHQLEFLLCPVHHNATLREGLTSLGFGLINERIVKENQRFYEIIHVSQAINQPIVEIGSIMWDLTTPVHQEYQQKRLQHYQRRLNSRDQQTKAQAQRLVRAYQALLVEQ